MDFAKITKADLLEYQKRFESDTAIARELGVTRKAIMERRWKYMIPSSRELTVKRNKKIRDLYLKGLSVGEVAKKTGHTFKRTYYILFQASGKITPRKKLPKISKPDLIRLQKKFKTDAAIGKNFDLTRQRIHQLRVLYGIPSLKPDTTARDAQIAAQYAKGVSTVAIAAKMGLSAGRVNQIIQKAKIAAKKRKK